MKFSVRVSYPEGKNYNWLEAVKTYKEIGFIEWVKMKILFIKSIKADINIAGKNKKNSYRIEREVRIGNKLW